MSGGFFRGTSADQDTRFSNKQAKLLKSQKFAPELEHLVNMEVIKPWITRRVTELLGFEDEVLINFIHSLLDAKEVNGKEVQIQITGFMEKNTGKFMKELWVLLLSAQKNASGVPQQFLDAKEEELQKKKAENDRITSEIQRKKDKEGRDIMEGRLKKLDGGFDAKDNDTASDSTLKPRDSGYYDRDGNETDKRNGVRARSRFSRSPHSAAVSTSPHRGSPSRSMSKSFSNSRSYSGGRRRSRSVSRSPEAQGRSLSFEKIRHSLRRRSISPRRHSPRQSPNRRLSYSRRRSRSRSNYRSPSPLRRRVHSPFHRSSPSFRRRRTPSPVRRRRSPSPVRRRRSPSPVRRRSPSPVRRRRSPSPLRRRRSPSPLRQRRSPLRRHRSRSPIGRGRSPSPIRPRSPITRHRSPSPSPVRRIPPTSVRLRSDSPMQSPSPIRRRYDSRIRRSLSPLRRRSPISAKKRSPNTSSRRSPSRDEWSSQSPVRRVSPSPPRHQRSPLQSSMGRVRTQERLSSETREPSSPLRSVQRDKSGKASHCKSQDSMSTPEKSPIRSVSPQASSGTSSEDRRPHQSPLKQRRKKLTNDRSLSPLKKQRTQKPSHYSPETREEAEEPYYSRGGRDPKKNSLLNMSKDSPVSKQKDSPAKFRREDGFSPERAAAHPASKYRHYDNNDWNKKDREIKRDKSSGKGTEFSAQQKSPMNKETFSREKLHESYAVDKDRSHSNYAKSCDRRHKSEATEDLVEKVDLVNQSASYDSVSEESGKRRREGKDRRKHKRSEKKYASSDEDYSYDSELEDRKEAKRKRKEEKKLRKEEKRRRREERRRRREERRTEKLKMKSKADDISDDEAEPMDCHRSDSEEMPSEQKKLEIELRNKALESLKAKRSMNN
ncbi:serine/arginine repetitive matrix protein 1 isoform X2 [Abrus precatorius]|uniref:Serine/arginine repetitive matrix protein 1 isoform X2 n=1 Tax=Abrus precatorius TaxID=3816 RepID=A0A8B8KPE3_ABRPR|nr:serine/arginine repetitive matrix protein 1 isoform X2 [Abrus precatorius]